MKKKRKVSPSKVNEIRRGRPLNVFVAKGSNAEKAYRSKAGLPHLHIEDLPSDIGPTPLEDLVFFHGRTIQDLAFSNFFVGGEESWDKDDIKNIDSSLADAMSDINLNNVMVQYFWPKTNITSTFKGSRILNNVLQSPVFKKDIEGLLSDLYSQRQIDGYDFNNTVFNFMLPSGTVLSDPDSGNGAQKITQETQALQEEEGKQGQQQEPRQQDLPQVIVGHEENKDSLNGLGGYHSSIHIQQQQGNGQAITTIYYSVGVLSEKLSDGRVNGIVAFDKPWKNLVMTFYHELNEARTDPDVGDAIAAQSKGQDGTSYLGWVSKHGDECGDFPMKEVSRLSSICKEVSLTNRNGTVPVQFMYSNWIHGPEGPINKPHMQ